MVYPFKRRQSIISCLLALLCSWMSANAMAQIKWDGEAGDGLWTSAANWVGNILPGITEDVVLDNSVVAGNYTVALPGAAAAVIIKTISISPAAGNTIQLLLPASNTAAPAFTATGPGYGITINNGGVLQNSSGAGAGNSIVVADSFRINNGGQYLHNTRAAHAALVTLLSKSPGTEKGVFIFDAPGGGYTIASTSRIYGTLVLSAAASGGSQAYATSAASPLTINGDLVIKPGVTLNLDITAATFIKGNYQQEGGELNLASQPNNNIFFIEGDFIQTAGSITETSTGFPLIELHGNGTQNIRAEGTITNSVGFHINNSSGVQLLSNLSLPYDLWLVNGIVHTQSFLLTLLAGCSLHADSLTSNSFINGAMRKEGLSAQAHFLFPVGKDITQRWLALKNASGSYTVSFIKANANTLGGSTGAGLHHISSIEYWSVQADAAPVPGAAIELSFDNVNSGGVTEMATLRVAQFVTGVWTDRGNTGTSGTAGSAGSVQSNAVSVFGPAAQYFTLASSDAFQNPLPLQLLHFSATANGNSTELQWRMAANWQSAYFEIQSAADGIHFVTIAVINGTDNRQLYQYTDQRKPAAKTWYRLKLVEKFGAVLYSNYLQASATTGQLAQLRIWPLVLSNSTDLYINAKAAGNVHINVFNAEGKCMISMQASLQQGNNRIPLQVQSMKAGIYMVMVSDGNRLLHSTRFVKQAF